MSKVFLSRPSYVVGTAVPVEEITDVPGLARRLRTYGFDFCATSTRTPAQLMGEAIAELLKREAVAPAVDAVVYASCSDDGPDEAVREVLAHAGLASVPLFGVWLAESGNLISAMRVARGLVRIGYRNVVVAVADAVPVGPSQYRAMANGVTVNGDGGAAVLVSSQSGPFVLEGLGQAADATLTIPGRATGLGQYLKFMAGVRGALEAMSAECGIEAASCSWLIANNYSRATLNDFADIAGIPHERVFRGNVARHGHIFTADGLINLTDLADSRSLSTGNRVLVLSTGPFSWGALCLSVPARD